MPTVWTFRTARFTVALQIAYDYDYVYDGDDKDGETQAALDSGELIAFDSRVVVQLDGVEIASDSLGGSVYKNGDESEFWTSHRSPDPMNRNCSIMRAARGSNVVICHYFPSMVGEAVKAARDYLANLPHVRAA